ncbi:MAG: hypothetical protein IJ679_01565 [Lachnospiraceae bacterium]|nr:hypothetical protein [Lachnospiraceae bacterium]
MLNMETAEVFESAIKAGDWSDVGDALRQIRHKQYAGALADYPGEILLVGINYTKKSGRYTCRIEKWEKGTA